MLIWQIGCKITHDMTIKELKTILTYANVDDKQRVRIRLVRPNNQVCEIVEIDSFETFSDGICLDVKPDILEHYQ